MRTCGALPIFKQVYLPGDDPTRKNYQVPGTKRRKAPTCQCSVLYSTPKSTYSTLQDAGGKTQTYSRDDNKRQEGEQSKQIRDPNQPNPTLLTPGQKHEKSTKYTTPILLVRLVETITEDKNNVPSESYPTLGETNHTKHRHPSVPYLTNEIKQKLLACHRVSPHLCVVVVFQDHSVQFRHVPPADQFAHDDLVVRWRPEWFRSGQ